MERIEKKEKNMIVLILLGYLTGQVIALNMEKSEKEKTEIVKEENAK